MESVIAVDPTPKCGDLDLTCGCMLVRNCAGSVLWKRIPGFTTWLRHYAPRLTNRELRFVIRACHGVKPTLPSVEALRRTYDLPMTADARRRAYAERDARAFSASPRAVRLLIRRMAVRALSPDTAA